MKKQIFFTTILLLINTFMLNNQVFANENVVPISDDTGISKGIRSLNRSAETEIYFLSPILSENMLAANELPFELAFIDFTPNIADSRPKTELVTKINNDMVIKDSDTLAAHSAILGNSGSKIEQTLGTASFEYTQTDSVSTTNSHSAGAELSTTAEMKFPFVSASISMKVKYDFNNTKAIVSSTTKKWTVPSQQIKVPAGHTYQINWLLKTGVATGTTDLSTRISTSVPYKWNDSETSELGNIKSYYSYLSASDAIKNERRLEQICNPVKTWSHLKYWEPENEDSALRKWGESTYTAKIGTQLIMNIMDVTTTNSKVRNIPVLVKSIPMDIIPTIVE